MTTVLHLNHFLVLQVYQYTFLGKNIYPNHYRLMIKPLSANPIKWSNTLKQFAGSLPTNCLSVFDHFMGLALKGLNKVYTYVRSRGLGKKI